MHRTAVPFLCLATLIGCSAAEEATSSSEDDIVEAKVIVGPEIVSCAVEPGSDSSGGMFGKHNVRCISKLPAGYPIKVEAIVSIVDKKGNLTSGKFSENAKEPLVAEIWNETFPVEVKLETIVSSNSDRVANLPDVYSLVQKATFEVSSVSPVTAKIPFDLWPIRVVGREVTVEGQVDGQPLSLGPMTSNDSNVIQTRASGVYVYLGKSEEKLYAVTPGSKLQGTARFGGNSLPFAFEGAGTYAAHADGFREVKAEDALPTSQGVAFAICSGSPSGDGLVAVDCGVYDSHTGFKVNAAQVAYAKDGVTKEPVTIPSSGAKHAVVATLPAGDTSGEIIGTFSLGGLVGLPKDLREAPLGIKLSMADILRNERNTFNLPFDAWPITIVPEADTVAHVFVASHLVPMSGEWGGLQSFKTDDDSFAADTGTTTAYVAADSHTESIASEIFVASSSSGDSRSFEVKLKKGYTYKTSLAGVVEAPPQR